MAPAHQSFESETEFKVKAATSPSAAKVKPAGKQRLQSRKAVSATTNLIAGGGAGMMEALVCHPLDTIKVRMQLSRRNHLPGVKPLGFVQTALQIAHRESPLGLYKGIGAVVTGIVPKMAIRFTSYGWYKELGADAQGNVSGQWTFMAGLLAGITEAVAVVNPMEVVKIRLQAQQHSMSDPTDVPRYRNAAHALYTIVREEGVGALYRGVSLTALRQGTNQAANFTMYSFLRGKLQVYHGTADIPSWQTGIIGLISGAMGPFCNAPIDTIKTRLQRTPISRYPTATRVEAATATATAAIIPNASTLSANGAVSSLVNSRGSGSVSTSCNGPSTIHQQRISSFARIMNIVAVMWREEGPRAFYSGITPRVMRVAPGQAVTFTVYEYLRRLLQPE